MKDIIEKAWEERASLNPGNAPRALREAVEEVIAGLDAGRMRVAEKSGGEWITHQWIKKAVLLSFRLEDNRVMQGGATRYFDKVPSKFENFDFAAGGVRVVPPAMARRGAYVARNVVLMPSYVNIGAYRRGHHGRHLGHGRLVRPDRQERAPFGRGGHRGRARADPGEPGDHRGQLLHRGTL